MRFITPARFAATIICVCTLVYFTACKKTDAVVSIYGTWVPATQTAVLEVNNVAVKDTSFTLTPAIFGYSSFTFNTNGQYSMQAYPSGATDTGSFTYTGGILNLTTGVNAGVVPIKLTASSFSFYNLDTSSLSPLTVDSITLFFSKQ